MYPLIPWYVTPIVLLLAATLTIWLYRMVWLAALIADIQPAARTRVRQATGLFLAIWLGLAFVLAPTTPVVDAAGRGVVPLTFLFFAGISLAVAIGLLAFSATWRRVLDAIPADLLISAQFYRVIGGALFLPLYAIGSIPGYFALPAGWATLRWDLRRRWLPLLSVGRSAGTGADPSAVLGRLRWDGTCSVFLIWSLRLAWARDGSSRW